MCPWVNHTQYIHSTYTGIKRYNNNTFQVKQFYPEPLRPCEGLLPRPPPWWSLFGGPSPGQWTTEGPGAWGEGGGWGPLLQLISAGPSSGDEQGQGPERGRVLGPGWCPAGSPAMWGSGPPQRPSTGSGSGQMTDTDQGSLMGLP